MRDDQVKLIEYRGEESPKIDIRQEVKEEPEQHANKEVVKIDYSDYEERLRKIREEK
jgi:hypothetical protein